MWYSLITIFISAFLLFQVQPLIGKFILPWFGGTAQVWTICMLFFQVVLLLGYIYSHLLIHFVKPRWQAIVHTALLLATLAVLPITPSDSWKPAGTEEPIWYIIKLLFSSVGLPYFMVSTTGPLIQAWFSGKFPAKSPYPLYALSNIGSLLALICYPFITEVLWTRLEQAHIWSAGFALFAVLAVFSAWRMKTAHRNPAPEKQQAADTGKTSLEHLLLWIIFPMFSCILLISSTNYICQDIAAIPFLWVLPLIVYLLTFILCFSGFRVYHRWLFAVLFNVGIGLITYIISDTYTGIVFQIAVFILVLFTGCMICHGELYRLKPDPRKLTLFYLLISAGGAIGGIFTGIIAPQIYSINLELYISITGCYLFFLIALYLDKSSRIHLMPRGTLLIVTAFVLVLIGSLYYRAGKSFYGTKATTVRNFYGIIHIRTFDDDKPGEAFKALLHGSINHGFQYIDPERSKKPTSYFTETSGAGLSLTQYPEKGPRRVGIVGLGVGTLAAYGREGDYYKFYEINPAVINAAKKDFTYLSDSKAKCEIASGDARLTMEREAPQNFDLIFMDAFSGDSIPVHLITEEAFRVYFRNLKPGGALVINASNRHIDIFPICAGLAEHFGKKAVSVVSPNDIPNGVYASEYLIVTDNKLFISRILESSSNAGMVERDKDIPLWTDDFNNLYQVLK